MASIDLLNLNWSVVYQFIIYLLTLLVLARWIIRPLQRTFALRAERLGADVAMDALDQRIAEAESDYADLLKQVRSDSSRVRREIRDAAKADQRQVVDAAAGRAQARLKDGRDELKRSLAETREEIRRVVPEHARSLATKIMGREIG